MEQLAMREETIQLEQADSLLLYTDGLTEAFSSEGDLFGEARLIDSLRAASSVSADDLLESVERGLNEFLQNQPLADDLTMLAVHRVQ